MVVSPETLNRQRTSDPKKTAVDNQATEESKSRLETKNRTIPLRTKKIWLRKLIKTSGWYLLKFSALSAGISYWKGITFIHKLRTKGYTGGCVRSGCASLWWLSWLLSLSCYRFRPLTLCSLIQASQSYLLAFLLLTLGCSLLLAAWSGRSLRFFWSVTSSTEPLQTGTGIRGSGIF